MSAEQIEKLMVQREDGLYDRVRKHQLEPRHCAYYDDTDHFWHTVPGREQEFADLMGRYLGSIDGP